MHRQASAAAAACCNMSKPVSGHATYTFPDGKKYSGEWMDGQPHGNGKMVLSNGNTYEGAFRCGLKEGKGVATWPDGTSYEGGFINDNKEGQGFYKQPNGNTYQGAVSNDLQHGKGVWMYAVDGRVSHSNGGCSYNAKDKFEGFFRANKRHGPCKYTFFNGETFECTFVDGQCSEFVERQAAVRAAPDPASAQARAEGYASVEAKVAAEAANKAKYSLAVGILQRLDLHAYISAFMKEDITNEVLALMTFDDLRSIGLSIGNARRVKQEIDGHTSPAAGVSSAAAAVLDVSSLSLSPLPPPSPSSKRTLASSNFKAAHAAAKDVVKLQHEMFAAIFAFLVAICRVFSAPTAAAEDLFHRLQGESFENPKELLSQIQVAATRIWTSTQKLQGCGVPEALNVEFCSLINRALRDDIADVMPHLVIIVRAINALCIVRRDEAALKFPPNSVSHRGGALPTEHHAFFAPGQKYRVPMYLATSFSEDKAYEFWYRAFAMGQVPVHWVVHFDPRGEHMYRYRCKNVNLVEKTVKGVEDELEFLFVPYSVFSVISVTVPAKITGNSPVVVHIEAAIDNMDEEEDLPLAPWH